MTTLSLPYFFAEALLASNARQPGDREKALGLSLDDVKWLQNVYLATQTARKAHPQPMLAHRLLLSQSGNTTPLAGALVLSRADGKEVTLYTPWKGLIKYAGLDDLKSQLSQWLQEDDGKFELLRFLSVQQRGALSGTAAPTLSTEEIPGAVFEDQEDLLELNQQKNLHLMMSELLQMPTLQSMLDETLKNALFKPFPKLDQRLTRMTTFIKSLSAFDGRDYLHPHSSLSLSEALMHYYLHNQWPGGDSRAFSHPQHPVSTDADNRTWEGAVREIAQSFTPHMQSLIETFWNLPMSKGAAGTGPAGNNPSRREFFSEAMRDTYQVKLLLQHQSGVLTADEYVRLRTVGPSPDSSALVSVEKVRVTAPLMPYVELAATLMIGSNDTLGFLYCPSRGIEATSDLAAVKQIVLEMMRSEGHADTLLNFMSLAERGTYLSLPSSERLIKGEPVHSAVFEHLLDDIVGKQLDNFAFALKRYRESEGVLDPGALCDSALDVRGLIDARLLAPNANGRWSTRVDQRWSSRPATVRAELAKDQLTLLTTVEAALERRIDLRPTLAASTKTVAEAQRVIDSSLADLQADVTHIMTVALRSELTLRAIDRSLDPVEQAMIHTLLDNPIRSQRVALNGFFPDAFALAVQPDTSTDLLQLASCFVVTERGGLDPLHSGKAVLWTPAQGFERFTNVKGLLAELDRRLQDEDLRGVLLENLGRSERASAKTFTLAPLQRIDAHFIEYLQEPGVRMDEAGVAAALATTLPATAKAHLLELVALRQPHTGMHRARSVAGYLASPEHFPVWLAKAPVAEQILHAELAQQYLDNVSKDQDFLSGIGTLARTAHRELQKQLKADDFDLDPDAIQISPRPMSADSEHTLTGFALTHFQQLDAARFTVKSLNASKIPEAINETYIKALIRNLQLGEHQQKVTTAAFTGTEAGIAERRKRFDAQLPWQLMLHAHAEKLQERLSADGFDLICQVMDMPDAIAREAVAGTRAIIRPLTLTGINGATTINVPGIWLIGSRHADSERQILLAPCSPTHSLKEYDNEKLLLDELKAEGALRTWTLNSLPAADRALCKAQLSLKGSKSAAIGLGSVPIKGGLFKQLFNDNVAMLGRLLGCQADADAQEEWAAIKHVLGEDLGVASSFAMGKLAYPLTVWQSFRHLKQSADDLQTHQWGSAVEKFIRGIAQLAMLRQSMESPAAVAPASEAVEQAVATARAWPDVDITANHRTRLHTLASTDVDLGALTLDAGLGLYSDAATKKRYAPIQGKVFQVQKNGQQWRVTGIQARGPKVLQDAKKQWLFSRDSSPARFSLHKRLQTAAAVYLDMNVDARGMSAIRLLYPNKARQISDALDLATTYAWNSFRNVQLLKATDGKTTAVHQVVMDFLGVQTVLAAHVTKIEKAIEEVFSALLDPTLRKPKSRRFVIGRLWEDADNTFAFTVPTDEKNKIYLAEKFFLPRYDHYRRYLTDRSFPLRTHARATTLIHELSHLVSGTEDIGYVDSSRPFSDLIDESVAQGKALKTALKDIEENTLSIKTPYTQLFMLQNPDTGGWEDLGDTIPEQTVRARDLILKLTGEENLAGARQKFKKDSLTRLSVQLANADSVAWLITHLGRQLHVDTP